MGAPAADTCSIVAVVARRYAVKGGCAISCADEAARASWAAEAGAEAEAAEEAAAAAAAVSSASNRAACGNKRWPNSQIKVNEQNAIDTEKDIGGTLEAESEQEK